jgi:hypothetical protein
VIDQDSESDKASSAWPTQSLTGILDETVVVFGKHWWKFIGIVLITQLPESIVSLVVTQTWGWGSVPIFFGLAVIGFLAKTIAFGATVIAVGQHYVSGRVDVRLCYRRVRSQGLSLTAIGVAYGLIMLLIVGLVRQIGSIALVGVFLLALIAAMVALVYWSMTVQIVMTERMKILDAAKNSMGLVSKNWLRLFLAYVVFGVVALGMGIVLNLPFAIGTFVTGLDTTFGLPTPIAFAAALLIETLVPPVLFIGWTMLYYNLRATKQSYNLDMLRQEMGVIPA